MTKNGLLRILSLPPHQYFYYFDVFSIPHNLNETTTYFTRASLHLYASLKVLQIIPSDLHASIDLYGRDLAVTILGGSDVSYYYTYYYYRSPPITARQRLLSPSWSACYYRP